jgi:uncharacterized protein (TIGR02246 family)
MNRASIPSLPTAVRFAQLIFFLLVLTSPVIAVAGPREEANAVIDRWAAAYSTNDPEAVVKHYSSDAILLGTVSPVLSQGTEAIRTYFSVIRSGNKNAIGERHTLVLNDNAVLVTGFYDFTRMKDGQSVPSPSRFTIMLIRDGGEWLIAHHHSSPRAQPTK